MLFYKHSFTMTCLYQQSPKIFIKSDIEITLEMLCLRVFGPPRIAPYPEPQKSESSSMGVIVLGLLPYAY